MSSTLSDPTFENAGAIQAGGALSTSAVVYAPLVINPIFGTSIRNLTPSGIDHTTAAEIENAVSAAINFYDTNFTSSVPAVMNHGTISNPVTVNIQFDYGTVDGNLMAPGSGVGESESSGTVYSTYAQLLAALSGAVPDLPLLDPTRGGAFLVPDAQAKVLGISSNNATVDGYVGLNTVANGVTLDYNLANQSVAGESGVVGTLEHEITEVMGRIAIDGTETDQQSNAFGISTTPLYSILDLYRYTAPNQPALTPGAADYFSLNNGTTDLGAFNNFANGGDPGDWASSVIGDAYDAFLTAGVNGTISTLDTLVLGAIGLLPAPVLSISGTAADQTGSDTTSLTPFQAVTIADRGTNQTETVTVTMSAAANGTLSNLAGGTFSSGTGVYSVSGSAASVSAALDGLVFTPTPHQVAAGQTVTTTFAINVSDTAGSTVTDNTTSVVTTDTIDQTASIAAAYLGILRTQPSTALLDATATQIASGQLTLAGFETNLISGEQAMETTLPALVTIDAFYDATPGGALLTTVATATSGTSYDTAQELHGLGYSDANVWTILGAGWGADHGSGFFGLYAQDATGTTAGYTAFLDAAYQQEFGAQPASASLASLLADIPGLTALLSGGGNVATPIQVMGGLYGYLLYAGQTNAIGRLAGSADAFLLAAANGTVAYGPELTQEFPTAASEAETAGGTVISVTSAAHLIDPGLGSPVPRFLTEPSIFGTDMGPPSGFPSHVDASPASMALAGRPPERSGNVPAVSVAPDTVPVLAGAVIGTRGFFGTPDTLLGRMADYGV